MKSEAENSNTTGSSDSYAKKEPNYPAIRELENKIAREAVRNKDLPRRYTMKEIAMVVYGKDKERDEL